MEDKLKCKTCEFCSFQYGNGNSNRYYCVHPNNPSEAHGIAGVTIICRCGIRGKSEGAKVFTRKTTPRWCPLNEK